MRNLLILLFALTLVGCKSTRNLDVVSDFDIERYMGTWYEAVRYPHRFEKGLSSVTATYSLRADGTITVLNRGYNDAREKWESIEGTAKPRDKAGHGWLKVSFFKPFYASYKILYLDAGYTRAIVTGPTYTYFWILVRDPALPEAELEELITKAETFGFKREKMTLVNHTRNHP